MKVWHLVELEENPNIACIKWQQMFLGIVDYRAPCKRRRVGNASVWIFKSAFRNQLEIALACVVSGISLKIDHAAFFLPTVAFRIVLGCLEFIFTDSFLTFNYSSTLPLAVEGPKNSSHTTPNCFPQLPHTPHSLLIPDHHPP